MKADISRFSPLKQRPFIFQVREYLFDLLLEIELVPRKGQGFKCRWAFNQGNAAGAS
jgi:hypothetical protein